MALGGIDAPVSDRPEKFKNIYTSAPSLLELAIVVMAGLIDICICMEYGKRWAYALTTTRLSTSDRTQTTRRPTKTSVITTKNKLEWRNVIK